MKRPRVWLLAALALLGATPAAAETLFLEVELNGRATGLIIPVERGADGDIAVSAAELRGLRVPVPASTSDRPVPLRDLPGLVFRYDDGRQCLSLQVAADRLAPTRLDASAPTDRDGADDVGSSTGALIGYSLFAGTSIDGAGLSPVNASAAIDARGYGPWGEAVTSGVLAVDRRGAHALRLDTRWAAIVGGGDIRATVGDAITGSVAWSRSIRFGGVQVRRDFELRPDLVTLPLPSVSGSAAVPSSLDLYLNGALNSSAAIGEGRYRVDNLPAVTGAGEARVVTRDIQGREVVTRRRFFVSGRQLRAGLTQFSGEAGVARRDYGVRSWEYGDRPFLSASGRVGLSGGVTWEGHGEVAPGLLLAGTGIVLPLGGFGVVAAAGAASHADQGEGVLLHGSVETGRGGFHLGGEVTSTTGGYYDLAAVTLPAARALRPGENDGVTAGRPPRLAARASASIPVPVAGGSVSISYAAERRHEGASRQSVSGYYGRSFADRLSFQASFVVDLHHRRSGGLFAALNVALGNRTNASVGVARAPGATRATLDASRTAGIEPGSLGWRLTAAGGDRGFQSGAVQYRTGVADLGAQVTHAGRATFGSVVADGALVFDGGVFASSPITGAFAVVDTGVAGVTVLHENQRVGRTNDRGRLLVPNLRAFERSRLSVDTDSLPVDVAIATADRTVRPVGFGGVRVAFDLDRMGGAALVHLVDEAGVDLPVGATIEREGGAATVVGYDGLAMLEGLTPRSRLTVRTPVGACEVDVAFNPPVSGLATLGPLTCRRPTRYAAVTGVAR